MPNTLKAQRYQVILWIDGEGEVEDKAYALPNIVRPASGPFPEQAFNVECEFTPSDALKSALKAEQKTVVDTQVAS